MTASSPDLRVLLFDIDGTLLVPTRRGIYRAQVRQALIEIFGTAGIIDQIAFAGKTDRQILREALEVEGITAAQIQAQLPEIGRRFVSIIQAMAADGPVFNCCAGVEQLLAALSRQERYLISLLTGNVEPLAMAKLEMVGLRRYFHYRGAFGSDNEDRRQLPALAAERIEQASRLHGLRPEQFIIIGDTPRDIDCARYYGARVLAVASGGTSSVELAALKPDLLFNNLADTSEVLAALAEI